MVDGIDGLLAGLSSVSFAGLGTLMFINGKFGLLVLCPYLCVVAVCNVQFEPVWGEMEEKCLWATPGSMLIGFTIIWILLLSTQGQRLANWPDYRFVADCRAVGDMVAVIIRRLKKGKKSFKPDRFAPTPFNDASRSLPLAKHYW